MKAAEEVEGTVLQWPGPSLDNLLYNDSWEAVLSFLEKEAPPVSLPAQEEPNMPGQFPLPPLLVSLSLCQEMAWVKMCASPKQHRLARAQ